MLPPRLEAIRAEIEDYAREYGLDFFQQIFEIVDSKQISEIAAYGGFPTRYPHWRFGMDFDRLDKGYTYGLQRIYEMVINNDPCYAYLMSSNPEFDQKTVIAHVYAHNDFFKNNRFFANTNRKMMDEMANHAARIRRYIDRFGQERVEEFLDRALSLDNLIDPHFPSDSTARFAKPKEVDTDSEKPFELPRLNTRSPKSYMERYINPKEILNQERQRMEEEKQRREKRFPAEPIRDVLGFLIEHAPLKDWQLDILSIVREEAYYFAPQGMTKILNEGWATYWHSRIMTEKAMKDHELIDYADHYSGVVATSQGQLNPYKLGVELLRDVEDRYNKGRFGKDYYDCTDMHQKLHWDTGAGKGREKLFEIRKFYNDITFIDEFLTPEFAIEQKLFTFGYNERAEQWEIVSREFEKVKQQLLTSLTNSGNPFIYAIDANFQNRGELLLQHRFEGIPLNMGHAGEVIKNIQYMWDRPVNLLTYYDEKALLVRYDGHDLSHNVLESEQDKKEGQEPDTSEGIGQ